MRMGAVPIKIGAFLADLRARYRLDLSTREVRIAEREQRIMARELELDKSLQTSRDLRRKLQHALDALEKE